MNKHLIKAASQLSDKDCGKEVVHLSGSMMTFLDELIHLATSRYQTEIRRRAMSDRRDYGIMWGRTINKEFPPRYVEPTNLL